MVFCLNQVIFSNNILLLSLNFWIKKDFQDFHFENDRFNFYKYIQINFYLFQEQNYYFIYDQNLDILDYQFIVIDFNNTKFIKRVHFKFLGKSFVQNFGFEGQILFKKKRNFWSLNWQNQGYQFIDYLKYQGYYQIHFLFHFIFFLKVQ